MESARRARETIKVTIKNIRLNHNYNKIVKSDWLSTALISALIGQLIGQYASYLSNRTVCAIMPVSYTHLTLPTNREV